MKPAGIFLLGILLVGAATAQVPGAGRLWPNLRGQLDQSLRYRPNGEDFVIENGNEFFNRPLYGGNTAFRVDAGDRPEFVLYLPGRGGNLRFGLRTPDGAKWLHEARRVTARYRPGEMRYEIRDPLLGRRGSLRLTAIALHQTEGLVVRIETVDVAPDIELVWAYGGVNGERGRRDGDIGTEAVPIREWFQLRPEYCRGNELSIGGEGFVLHSPAATIVGRVPAGSDLRLADASAWPRCAELFSARCNPGAMPVVVGSIRLAAGPLYFGLQRVGQMPAAAGGNLTTYREAGAIDVLPGGRLLPAFRYDELPGVFAAAEAHFAAVRGQVRIETPDPYLDAAVGALNVAADAVWDEPQGAMMHGAIAWRTKLLGWRGPYALDALGWFDRARRHLAYWAGRQNTDPIPDRLPPPDAGSNLARSEAALHSNGDISHSHYDMNLVYIDALFRHLLWTGDMAFARETWPVIVRHLAWERRLFRREFPVGDQKLPLYEGYAAIWASDDLEYEGGGTAHASAYNYWHNLMAARLAGLLGQDPAPYAREAELIARGVRRLLWTGDHFAECKDLLGQQLVHPNAGLWTYYHLWDAGLPTNDEAAWMSQELFTRLAPIPVRGRGVPADRDYAVFPTTDWLPYTWSTNNVVMGENAHTALGLWEAGQPERAFTLMKSALLASMYMGICPGNVGSMNYLDVYRRESQRDFADGAGITARAIVEGLFGVRPDALAGELRLAPGFPASWDHAALHHPRIDLTFARRGAVERFVVTPRFERPMSLRLDLQPHGVTARVKVNGRELPEASVRRTGAVCDIECGPAEKYEVSVEWQGAAPVTGERRVVLSPVTVVARHLRVAQPQPIDLTPFFNDRVTQIFRPGKYVSPRSPFVSLAIPSQGIGAWAGEVNATAEIDDSGLRRAAAEHGGRFELPDGTVFATPGPGDAPNVLFVSQWDNYPREATMPLRGRARQIVLLMAGSTNPMQSRIDNGEVVVTYSDGTTARLTLRNPETWWPIEQDYFLDDCQFRADGPLPIRVDLKTGRVRVLQAESFKGKGGPVPGGAATVLDLPLDPSKELRSLTVRALANDVVIGLMAATLTR
ncbi:MAG TPA: DUF4450 domain-containing protein [Lacunisphaera sp.]|nr:DUF4450 domain-containing protein [Lacunisphaera sp.]